MAERKIKSLPPSHEEANDRADNDLLTLNKETGARASSAISFESLRYSTIIDGVIYSKFHSLPAGILLNIFYCAEREILIN